jgi:hypothetical protein
MEMKDFFEEYVAIPLGILLLIFIAPTVVLGGLNLAATLFANNPVCEVKK